MQQHCTLRNIRLKNSFLDDTDSSVCMAVSKGSTFISFYSCELSQLCGTQAQFYLFIFYTITLLLLARVFKESTSYIRCLTLNLRLFEWLFLLQKVLSSSAFIFLIRRSLNLSELFLLLLKFPLKFLKF